MFKLLKTDTRTRARLGRLTTAHGPVDTPVYMPVGTQASVKALDPRELREMGTQIILGNTYHLNIRPGLDIIRAAGGLHRFINWPAAILTDSGGFQVFSLATIRKIQEETGTEINVEDDGTVEIAAVRSENSSRAIQWIESLTREVEVGALYLGKVTRIMGFGAFVEILPGKEGLVRIGELADYHVPTVEDVVQVGDEIMVVVIEIDRQGRVNLSRKAAMQRHLAKAGEA